jgi:predicted metal-dependent phosphoesterase TrpH
VKVRIDLHLHTTVSDGRSTPEDLVAEAANAGLSTIAVTDHDTTGAWDLVAPAAQRRGMACIPGIEITAVYEGRDVHMLAYFVDPNGIELIEFLDRQRVDRRRRLFVMAEVLERLGVPVDRAPLEEAALAATGRSPGRPMLADALIRAGHVKTIVEAFERYLGEGRPAFVSREGASPQEVVALVKRAGGLSSLAHPGKLKRDDLIPVLAAAGLDAVEVHHPDHDEVSTARYRRIARKHSLLVTGGSDYHGEGSGRTAGLGRIGLGPEDYARLIARSGWSGARP